MTVPRFETLEDVQWYLDRLQVPTWRRYSAGALQNSWVNYGAGFADAEYWVSTDGIVELYGLIKLGIAGVIFTLPAGARPLTRTLFTVMTDTGPGRVDVYTSGDVVVTGGAGNTFLSLDGIRFHVA